ncbi:zinc-dependent alcohol dehydrogenase family protein [Acinetobacter pullicarnis]|uniref:zinc-dependent alcohol dehydrogenase family protein n=1 Tax=Acinetobacter pullicarnis TaxID=2576829 RepID=UPI00111D09DF|nr:NAD(P)-dependent alcohol dehydrogenase [Acinetobacter pullicarnis]
MKAIQLKKPAGFDSLHCVELPQLGEPQAGEIQVKICANSLNFHDLVVVRGDFPTAEGRIPMSDGAGVVTAVGAGVTEFAVGDHVVSCFFPTWQDGPANLSDFATVPGDGVDGYAIEQVNAPSTSFTHAPSQYSHAQAATLTTAALTAWRALVVDGKLKAGDTVLVLGTGGVSIFALQMAKSLGAKVIATTSSEAKKQKLLALGADQVINYRDEKNWGDVVLELTAGRGADIVVEVGGPATLAQSIRACRVGGHIALIGILTGYSGEIPTVELMAKQISLKGIIVGSREQQQEMVKALNRFDWVPVIDRTFSVDQMAEAFKYQESGQHFGKICIQH